MISMQNKKSSENSGLKNQFYNMIKRKFFFIKSKMKDEKNTTPNVQCVVKHCKCRNLNLEGKFSFLKHS